MSGDFTIAAVDENAHWILHNVLGSFVMGISEPTHLDGSFLDNIYINKYILQEVESGTYD